MNATPPLPLAPTDLNAVAAWIGALLGAVTGVVYGVFFHHADWLGGYTSWPRRMLRLGHISFFGIAALNLGYSLTLNRLGWPAPAMPVSLTLAAANFLMPAACALAAWRTPLRHLFAIPVACVLVGVVGLLWCRLGVCPI
jgi:hypothetical protein